VQNLLTSRACASQRSLPDVGVSRSTRDVSLTDVTNVAVAIHRSCWSA